MTLLPRPHFDTSLEVVILSGSAVGSTKFQLVQPFYLFLFQVRWENEKSKTLQKAMVKMSYIPCLSKKKDLAVTYFFYISCA